MQEHTASELRARVAELEAENRRLRERSAWAVMVLRDSADRSRRAIGELELELLVGD